MVILHYVVASVLSYRALSGFGSLSRITVGILIVGTVLTVGAQVLNSVGVLFQRTFTGYFIGLLWYVLASGMFFIRLVMAGFGGTKAPRRGTARPRS